MLSLIKPRHLSFFKKSNKNEEIQKKNEDRNTESSSPPKKPAFHFKRFHRNATRTKVTQYLEYKSERIQSILNPSLWLISKTYLKRLETTTPVIHNQEEKPETRRKVSWSQQAEYVYFNVRKNSASISQASRHHYSLDD